MFVKKNKIVLHIFIFTIGLMIVTLILFSLENQNKPRNLNKVYNNTKGPQLFNINLKYLMNNNELCVSQEEILAIMIITSHYNNIETRHGIRRGFSSEQLNELKIRRVFLLAVDLQPNNDVVIENQQYGDLVQGNFKEAYRNLTYKHMMGLNWVSTYCNTAKYMIKMDDDIVINMYKLRHVLNQISIDTLAGYILTGMTPIRDPQNKWYVTKQEYRKTMYPPFISGWFYITTPKIAKQLVQLSYISPYFWIDDVYVTGILAQKLNIPRISLNNIFAVHSEYLECCLRDLNLHHYDCNLIVGPNGGNINMFYQFNAEFFKCTLNQCLPPKYNEIQNTCIVEKKSRISKGKAIIETVQL